MTSCLIVSLPCVKPDEQSDHRRSENDLNQRMPKRLVGKYEHRQQEDPAGCMGFPAQPVFGWCQFHTGIYAPAIFWRATHRPSFSLAIRQRGFRRFSTRCKFAQEGLVSGGTQFRTGILVGTCGGVETAPHSPTPCKHWRKTSDANHQLQIRKGDCSWLTSPSCVLSR